MASLCLICQLKKQPTTKQAAKAKGLDTIFLAAPSTSNERLTKIVDASSGFLYLVSHFGVTGAKTAVEDSTVQLIQRVQPFTAGKIPLAVGFGISKPEHVQTVINAGADAAIVGSAFINIITKNQGKEDLMLEELKLTARSLKRQQLKTKNKDYFLKPSKIRGYFLLIKSTRTVKFLEK